MAGEPADLLPASGLARCGAGRRRRLAAGLGGGDAARAPRPAAGRRRLGGGQPAVARRRGPAHPARALRRRARGRAVARRRAPDRRGVSLRAAHPAGQASHPPSSRGGSARLERPAAARARRSFTRCCAPPAQKRAWHRRRRNRMLHRTAPRSCIAGCGAIPPQLGGAPAPPLCFVHCAHRRWRRRNAMGNRTRWRAGTPPERSETEVCKACTRPIPHRNPNPL